MAGTSYEYCCHSASAMLFMMKFGFMSKCEKKLTDV